MSCCNRDITVINQGKKCNKVVEGKNWKQIIVAEKIVLSDNMVNLKSIKSVTSSIKVYSTNFVVTPSSNNITNYEGTKLTGLKAFVSGEIMQSIIYEGVDNTIYVLSHTDNFSSYIILNEGTNTREKLCVNACIEDSSFNIINTREIVGNVGIFLSAS